MMKKYGPPASEAARIKLNNKYRAKEMKSEIYLKYSLLVDLMHIVKTYGRNTEYDFQTDQKLAVIKTGNFSDQENNDKRKITLAFDSFMTIWLLTLPENSRLGMKFTIYGTMLKQQQ